MKLRFPSAPPPLDKTARLPLLLCAALALGLVAQFVADRDVTPPLVGAIGGRDAGGPVAGPVQPAKGGPIIVARSMFSPRPSASANGGQGANLPDGPTVAGSIRVGRNQLLVMQGPGRRVAHVPVGGRIDGWQVIAIRQNEAMLARGEERITVPFGARGSLSTGVTETRSQ
ncbi:MAG: hypothetical protein J7498_01925 [Sphingobium sp.]|nr:hypothetical protein [Sphingobium sp.]